MNGEKTVNLVELLEKVPGEVRTLAEFVSVSREVRAKVSGIDSSQEFYLTECGSNCCRGNGTSYRFFVGMPAINRTGHADTGNRGFVTKVYEKPAGLCAELANFILEDQNGRIPQKIEVASEKGTCYRV